MKEVGQVNDKISKKATEVSKKEIKTFDEIKHSKVSEGTKTFNEIGKQGKDKDIKTFEDIAKQKEIKDKQIFEEYMSEIKNGNLIYKKVSGYQHIDEKNILSLKVTSPDWNAETPSFWKHHDHNEQFYNEMAAKYPKIKNELDNEKSLEKIKEENPELKEAAEFWYSRPIKLVKYGNHYIAEDGFHRVELAKKYNLGSIPAQITEACKKENE